MRRVALVACALLPACFTSPRATADPRATLARGITCDVAYSNRRPLQGELLAVGDSAYTLLVGQTVVVAMYHNAISASFHIPRSGGSRTGVNGWPSQTVRDDVVSYARFPLGIPPQALSALLRAGGQVAPDTARATR